MPKLQEGPDIIALTPTGDAAVIERTIGLPNKNDKLAKLVQRGALIKEKLSEAGHGSSQVQRVIVTPLSKEEVAASLETAGNHEIAVICKENLEDSLIQVLLPPDADRAFQNFKRLVPMSKRAGLFQL
jgi:hypothetical protein